MLRGDLSPLLINEITGDAQLRENGVVAFQWKQARGWLGAADKERRRLPPWL